MPNQEAIIANIKKLEGMGLHGEELLQQLQTIGIPRVQAERWIREAHGSANEAPAARNNAPTFFEGKKTPPMNELEEKPSIPSAMENPLHVTRTFTTYAPPAPPAAEKLWEKAILTTIDSKLSQMERLKKEIDDVIEQHVNAHYEAMEKKMEVLFDAQRELFKFKMEAEMDAKTKEIEDILDQKINNIKTLNLSTQEDLQRIKGQKMQVEDVLKEWGERKDALDNVKKTILQDTGEKLEELQEKVDEMVNDTKTRIREVENRATKTLELEEKITSNLGEQMEEQANKILDERINDLRMEIKKEIVELKKMGADLASKDIQTIIKDFQEMNEKMEKAKKEIDAVSEQKTREMDKLVGQKMLEIDKIVNTKMETIVNQKEQSFFKKIDDQANEMTSVKRELGQKILETETRLQNLDAFQKQFIETIRKSNLEREELSNNLKKKLDGFDARADEKIAAVDQHIKQLDSVVGELAQLLAQWKNQQAAIPNPSASPETGKTGGISKLFKK